MRPLALVAILLAGCVEPIANMDGPIHINLINGRNRYATYQQDGRVLDARQLETALADDAGARAGMRSARRTERAGVALMISGGAQLAAAIFGEVIIACTGRTRDPRTNDAAIDMFGVAGGAVAGLFVPGLILLKAAERQVEITVGGYNERAPSR